MRVIFSAVVLILFSAPVSAESSHYRLFVISVEKGILLDANGSISKEFKFRGITQFETSNLGGGKFSTEEKCLAFLRKLVVERGGKGRGYKMIKSPYHYKEIMVEEDGSYHTERHCIRIE